MENVSAKPIKDRSEGDYYPTPPAITQELLKTGELDNLVTILEPCCGQYHITKELEKAGFRVESKDIIYGNDFLLEDYSNKHYDAIVTNPPFRFWDDFLLKAKQVDCKKIIFIGKVSFFGSHSRTTNKIWENLSDVYVFDRQIAYDRELRPDNKLYCGSLITGWFVWTKGYTEDPRLHVLDIQDLVFNKKRDEKGELHG